MKLKYSKALTLGICFTLMSTGAVLASGNVSSGGSSPAYDPGRMPLVKEEIKPNQGQINPTAPDYPVSSRAEFDTRSQFQKDIDKKLFEDYVSEISQKGIIITHTVEVEGYLEIGILPYNDGNASYIKSLLKEPKVKLVEGFQASTMPAMARDLPLTITSEPISYSEAVMEKQIELDKYMMKDNGKVFIDKGFNIYKTMPNEDYLEIGISPFTEENANYIYELLGKDNARVVEVPESELVYNTLAAESNVEDAVLYANDTEDSKPEPFKNPMVLGLGALAVLGGGLIVSKRK